MTEVNVAAAIAPGAGDVLSARHLVLAVLSGVPRFYRDGRRVLAATWNGVAADEIVRRLTVAGYLASRADPGAAESLAGAGARVIDAHTIVAAVAESAGLPVADVTGQTRVARVVRARQIAMFLCREVTDLSLPEIGRLFERDHTTVLHAVRQVPARVAADPVWADQLAACRRALPAGTAAPAASSAAGAEAA